MPYCNNNGTNIHFLDGGSGLPLILLHGLGSHSKDWHPQYHFFNQCYRVIAIDLRGHGKSDSPQQAYSVPQYASDVLAVMNHLDIHQAHLVGFSMGGMTAFQLAVDAPERIHSLTIINSGPHVDSTNLKIKMLFFLRITIIHLLGMRTLGKLIARNLFPNTDKQALYKEFVEHISQIPKQTYIRTLKSFLGWNVSDKLNRLSMPVLIVAADQDYTPLSKFKAYARLIPNAQLVVIENSRHATPMDQPDKLNQVIDQFLSHPTTPTPQFE